MDKNIELEIQELGSKIAELPVGRISEKNIKGKVYYYHCPILYLKKMYKNISVK